jgi:mono/diheme cytochrome c family protein
VSRRVLAFLCTVAIANAAPDFTRDIRPLLETHCFDCHGDEAKPKGGVNLERFGTDAAVMADREVWGSVFNKVESHQMPPPKRDSQPTDAERAKMLAWIADIAARPDPNSVRAIRGARFYGGSRGWNTTTQCAISSG